VGNGTELQALVANTTYRAKTKTDYAYETLRSAILSNKLKPGTPLQVSEIAEHLGISDIPVREALNRLSAQRLVKIEPHVGAYVARPSRKEMEDCLQLRELLEPWATGLAAGHLDSGKISKLRRMLDEMESAFAEGDFLKFGSLNRDFHKEIYSACPNREAYRLIMNLWDLTERCITIFGLKPRRMEESISEHRVLLEALERGDGNTAANLTREHKKRSFAAYFEIPDNSECPAASEGESA